MPKGNGIKAEPGRKVSGTMKLIQVKDLLDVERDSTVKQEPGVFYIVLLSKAITELGLEQLVTRRTIEKLCPADFAFLIDFMHEVNHQVIKQVPLICASCGHTYWGAFAQLGEA